MLHLKHELVSVAFVVRFGWTERIDHCVSYDVKYFNLKLHLFVQSFVLLSCGNAVLPDGDFTPFLNVFNSFFKI